MTPDLEAYIGQLRITQGRFQGQHFELLPWERTFLAGAFAPGVTTAALTLGRGNGKSCLVAAIGAAALDGPLSKPRGEVVCVASSFAQGRSAIFEAAKAFLMPKIEAEPKAWRLQDSVNTSSIEHRPTGSRLRVLGSDPRRAHGLAPALLLADEPSQWPTGSTDAMYSALLTARGKIPDSRLIALGTRPAAPHHWFSEMLSGGADYAIQYDAPPDSDPFDPASWHAANPSLHAFPDLLAVVRSEAEKAKSNPALLAAFKSLRLNMGVPDTAERLLLQAEDWRSVEVEELPPAEGPCVLAVDLGSTSAMSAATVYYPATGRLECMAAFPGLPSLEKRGRDDGVGTLYRNMADRGELIQVGRNTVSVPELLAAALERWGAPDIVVADRWKQGDLLDALEASGMRPCPIHWRGMGFRDGSPDILAFERAVLEGRVKVLPSLLLRSALAESRVQVDPAGNRKLARNSEGGRRSRARDDAATSTVLAVAVGSRGSRLGVDQVEAPRYAII